MSVGSRERMIGTLKARGVRDSRVLAAMAAIPRENFVSEALAEFAYEDSPLPIEQEQTISQPYIVAVMAEALELEPEDRVLEVGAGSGYAAAILSRLARQVVSIERHEQLASLARERLAALELDNVEIIHGDGTLGWQEQAPYDAIVVAAGGPEVPAPLLDQLAVGGRLVIPVGDDPRSQRLLRLRRISPEKVVREDLGGVRFVPLIGAGGWAPNEGSVILRHPEEALHPLIALLRECAEPFQAIRGVELSSLLERIGDARVVCLGEATHGTSEFYSMRAEITRRLIEEKDFDLVAVEGDWPDMAVLDAHVRGIEMRASETPFQRFPTWMWRNREFATFVAWLEAFNRGKPTAKQVGLHGLDVYSLFRSRDAVLAYLERIDPETAKVARLRYGCLSPWESEPALYGRAAVTGQYRSCEKQVVEMLRELLARRLEFSRLDSERHDSDLCDQGAFFDAAQNARVVVNAERYYRVMYYGHAESWNSRDQHMFDTLVALLEHRGPQSKIVIWEHNSHVGNSAATEMAARGELNVGKLVKDHFGASAFLVGFGTDRGTVMAASEWGGPASVKKVRPAIPGSYERLFAQAELPAALLHLRQPVRRELQGELETPMLERAIGVIYRPETELQSHYFQAILPWQFDSYVWFDRTRAVTPLAARGGGAAQSQEVADTFPFGI